MTTVFVPGSKSIANRALIAAALADGDSELTNVPDGDDTMAMLDCLRGLGVAMDGVGPEVRVAGTGGSLRPVADRLNARLAGTTSRFVTALAALAATPVTIDGDPPLRWRPMMELHEALASLGATTARAEGISGLPVTVRGPMHGGRVTMRGDVSSQFVTALMLIGPMLNGGLEIELTTQLVSLPYVRLTATVMEAFGVDDVVIGDDRITVPQGRYRATNYVVEPDASSASYPWALAAVRGGEVTVAGLSKASVQGDIAILELLDAMGCDVLTDEAGTTVSRAPDHPLRGIDVDMADISDLVPTVAVMAVTASTPTTIRGVGFIRAKESDRLGDLAAELAKTGASIRDTVDGLEIEPVPGGAAGLRGATLDTHHDHRLAMAFAVLAAAVDGIVIDDPAVVTKSWPGFWETYDRLTAS